MLEVSSVDKVVGRSYTTEGEPDGEVSVSDRADCRSPPPALQSSRRSQEDHGISVSVAVSFCDEQPRGAHPPVVVSRMSSNSVSLVGGGSMSRLSDFESQSQATNSEDFEEESEFETDSFETDSFSEVCDSKYCASYHSQEETKSRYNKSAKMRKCTKKSKRGYRKRSTPSLRGRVSNSSPWSLGRRLSGSGTHSRHRGNRGSEEYSAVPRPRQPKNCVCGCDSRMSVVMISMTDFVVGFLALVLCQYTEVLIMGAVSIAFALCGILSAELVNRPMAIIYVCFKLVSCVSIFVILFYLFGKSESICAMYLNHKHTTAREQAAYQQCRRTLFTAFAAVTVVFGLLNFYFSFIVLRYVRNIKYYAVLDGKVRLEPRVTTLRGTSVGASRLTEIRSMHYCEKCHESKKKKVEAKRRANERRSRKGRKRLAGRRGAEGRRVSSTMPLSEKTALLMNSVEMTSVATTRTVSPLYGSISMADTELVHCGTSGFRFKPSGKHWRSKRVAASRGMVGSKSMGRLSANGESTPRRRRGHGKMKSEKKTRGIFWEFWKGNTPVEDLKEESVGSGSALDWSLAAKSESESRSVRQRIDGSRGSHSLMDRRALDAHTQAEANMFRGTLRAEEFDHVHSGDCDGSYQSPQSQRRMTKATRSNSSDSLRQLAEEQSMDFSSGDGRGAEHCYGRGVLSHVYAPSGSRKGMHKSQSFGCTLHRSRMLRASTKMRTQLLGNYQSSDSECEHVRMAKQLPFAGYYETGKHMPHISSLSSMGSSLFTTATNSDKDTDSTSTRASARRRRMPKSRSSNSVAQMKTLESSGVLLLGRAYVLPQTAGSISHSSSLNSLRLQNPLHPVQSMPFEPVVPTFEMQSKSACGVLLPPLPTDSPFELEPWTDTAFPLKKKQKAGSKRRRTMSPKKDSDKERDK